MFNSDLFYRYLFENEGRRFKYGEWDCFVFVEGYYRLRTGREYFASIKGKYKTIQGYLRKLKKMGYSSIYALMEDTFCSTSLSLTKRGDIVLYKDCLGLCDGNRSIFLNQTEDRTYSFIDTYECQAAYIIDRGVRNG